MSLSKSNSSNYKRIAKNAAMLYFRMLFTIIVTLYISRVVLQTLGIEDFGVYSVVAGFVAMLGFLNNAMTTSTQRFLSFELGKSNEGNIKQVFSMSMNIHILIAIVALILGETFGLWFVNNKLNIPTEKIFSAKLVFHLAVFTFMLNVVTVPYKALIIAHEKINVFTWISIADVTLKLIAVIVLTVIDWDKLVLYGLINLIVIFLVFVIYKLYCRIRLPDSNYQFIWDAFLFKTIMSFTGWNLWSNLAYVMSGQGVNILLNIFFGPAVNAARSIAMEVSIGLNSFVSSLQVAVNPQIVKSYAANNLSYMYGLVCYGAKYNFILLFFISMPVFINTDFVIKLWLGSNPEYTSTFVRLIIINILIECISAPLMTSAGATGNIKKYQLVVGSILLLNVPLAYVALKVGYSPTSVVYVSIFTAIIALIARLFLLKKLVSLPVFTFAKEVVGRSLLILISTFLFYKLLISQVFTITNFWYESTLLCVCIFIATITFGIDHIERTFLLNKLNRLVLKNK